MKNYKYDNGSPFNASQRERLGILLKNMACGMSPIPMFGILFQYPDIDQHTCACSGRPYWGEEKCSPGKHPRIRWSDAQPMQEMDVLGWFHRECREGHGYHNNWAFRMDYSGLVGLDIDPRNGGEAEWASLVEKYGMLPRTPIDFIPGRGWHAWFKDPGSTALPAVTKIDLAPGVEFKHGKTYIAGPPSMHKVGEFYQWRDGLAPWETPFTELPQWIADLAWEKTEQSKPRITHRAELGGSSGVSIPATGETFDRARAYLSKLPVAIQGQNGSKDFFRAACILVMGFGFSTADARPLLAEYSDRCLPPWSDGEIEHALNRASNQPGVRGYLLSDGWRGGRRLTPDEEFLSTLEFTEVPIRVAKAQRLAAQVAALEATVRVPFPPVKATPEDIARDASNSKFFNAAINADKAAEAKSDAAATPTHEQARPFCPHPRRILLGHNTACMGRLALVGCRAWDCPGCRPVKQDRWKTSMGGHIFDEGPDATLFAMTIPAASCKALVKRIRRMGGQYFKAATLAGDYFILSNLSPPGIETKACAPDDARARLFAAIDALPWHYDDGERPISSSRGWKLADEETKTGEWHRIGEVSRTTSMETIREILAKNDLHLRERLPKSNRTWVRWVIDFAIHPSKLEHLHWQLSEGFYCPEDLEFTDVPLSECKSKGGRQRGDEVQPTATGDELDLTAVT